MLDKEKGLGLITRYGPQLEQVARVVTVATDLPWPPIPDFKSRYPIAFGWKVRNQELDIDTMFGMGFSSRSVDEVTVRLGYKMTNSHPKPAIIYEGSKLFITEQAITNLSGTEIVRLSDEMRALRSESAAEEIRLLTMMHHEPDPKELARLLEELSARVKDMNLADAMRPLAPTLSVFK